MNQSEVFKIFGPLSVVATGLAIALMIYKWQGDKSMSISQNAASHKSTYLMMLIVQSVTLPMLFLFWSKWLAPTLQLPSLFTLLAGMTSLGLLLAAWVPDTKGRNSKIHGLLAYGAGIPVIPMLIMLYLSSSISSAARYITIFVLLYEISVIVIVAILKKGKSIQLYLQAAYIFLFALTTVAASYI